MSDAELENRRLDLEERDLILREKEFASKHKFSFLELLKSLGLPLASIVASLAVFVIQQQQQTFTEALDSMRSGYTAYFTQIGNLGAIDSLAKFDEAEAIFDGTTQAFPEVFCGARQDYAKRLNNSPLDRPLIDGKIKELSERGVPKIDPGYESASRTLKLSWLAPRPTKCEPLQVQGQTIAEAIELPPPEPVAAAPGAPSPVDSAPSPSGVATPLPATKDAKPEIGKRLPAILRPAKTEQLYRVFFHVGPARDTRPDSPERTLINTIREDGASLGLRVVTGIQTVDGFDKASIRFYGAEERPAAERLKKLLEGYYATEFTLTELGKDYPKMPRQNIEVWLPDGVKARK
jgi:hypothetical protein